MPRPCWDSAAPPRDCFPAHSPTCDARLYRHDGQPIRVRLRKLRSLASTAGCSRSARRSFAQGIVILSAAKNLCRLAWSRRAARATLPACRHSGIGQMSQILRHVAPQDASAAMRPVECATSRRTLCGVQPLPQRARERGSPPGCRAPDHNDRFTPGSPESSTTRSG